MLRVSPELYCISAGQHLCRLNYAAMLTDALPYTPHRQRPSADSLQIAASVEDSGYINSTFTIGILLKAASPLSRSDRIISCLS